MLDFFFSAFRLLGRFLLGCCQHLADGGPLLLGECFGRELPERLFQIVRILGLEDHDVVGRLGSLVFAQGKVHAVLLGAGLERPDVRLRDFNVGQSRAVGFQLFQALLAVMQLWPLDPVLQVFFQRSLQGLGGEFARFHGAGMGLPNMMKCSDDFDIQSTVGSGTNIKMKFKHISEDL